MVAGSEHILQAGDFYTRVSKVGQRVQQVKEQVSSLVPMTATRTVEMSILDRAGHLPHHAQPPITKCLAVKQLIPSYVIANCELAEGRTAELVTELSSGDLPP